MSVKLKKTKVYASLMLAFGGSLALGVAPSLAQQTQQQQALEGVQITGSRILSPNAESPSPLQVITSEEIRASGATNLQELLLKNPTMGTPTLSRTNSNFLTSSAGVSTIDLRNLGISRTLVLVNGRRFVSGISGETAVDLNTIPTDFVERIELLTGGSSSTYGSDAVAGVVNIILKRNFEGFLFDASYGESEEGDDTKRRVGLTWGTASAKGSLMGYIGYSDQGAVLSRDRNFAAVDQISEALFSGEQSDFFNARRPFFSSFTPQGYFFGDTTTFTYDRQGNIIPPSTNGVGGTGVGATGFNRSEFRTIAVPTERYLFSATGDYAVADKHSVFFEGTYAASQTKSRLEPYPLGAEDIYPASGGQVPAEFMVNGVLLRNPLVPDALFNDASDNDGDGLRDYYFTRRLSEVGTRGNVADRDTFRILTGLRGSLTPVWNYDSYLAYGSTKESQVSSGQVNVLNFRNALEAIPDVDDVNGYGNTTEAVCRDANARVQGCVPINVFGFNSISPMALNYVTAPGLLATFTTQKLAGATVSGEPFQMPAGPLGLAAGVEYREEFSRSEFDPLQQAGLNAGNAIPRTEGEFDVTEFFAETRVPILRDAPFARQLNFTGAIRTGDYSTVGSTFSWNAGLEWAPIADLKFRGTRALSTRAPNINELFAPPSETFPTGLNDPCLGVTATTPGATASACRAAPGVAANIAANGAFTLNQADIQGVGGFDRGNPNLNEEEGKSTTLGLVFTPRSIPALSNFVFTLDYFDIEIDDAIVPTPRQFILDQCYGGDTQFCQFITRRPAAVGSNSAGSLEFIDSTETNSGQLAAEGIDVTVAYANRVGPGRLFARLAYTYLIDQFLIPLPGADKDEQRGEVGCPKSKALLNLGYSWGPWGITSSTTYIGKVALDDQFLAGFDLAPGSVTTKEKIYNDFQFTYQYRKAQFYLGIDNAFDTKPAPIISGLPGNNTGNETSNDYDPIGRRYYVGVRLAL